MSRMKTVTAIGLLLLPLYAQAQFKVHSVDSSAQDSGHPVYQLPQLTGTPADVAERANLWLQYSLLGTVADPNASYPFDKLDLHQGVVGLSYNVVAQTPTVLTLAFDFGYMGAYPTSSHGQQSLDLTTGRPIALADLFSADGLQRFNKRVARERVAAIDHLIAHPDPERLKDGGDDAASQREQYQQCRDDLVLKPSPTQDLGLVKDRLTVTLDCEFPHVIQALDDLGPLSHSETYSTLARDFSTYGQCLLVEQRRDCVAGSGKAHRGVYQGLLAGKLAITLMLVDDHLGGYEAFYFYDRYRIPIPLIPRKSAAEQLVLEHRGDANDHQAVTETFDLNIAAHGTLAGQWKRTGRAPMGVTLR